MDSLEELKVKVFDDLEKLNYLVNSWHPSAYLNGKKVLDVLIIGAGMFGLAAAVALRFEGIDNVKVIDKNDKGLQGPWRTYARMKTLNTPKELTGPAFNIPSLTFRSWYETINGKNSWEQLQRITPGTWMDYLDWYSDLLNIQVDNLTEAISIKPYNERMFIIKIVKSGKIEEVYARKVILATGIDGCGAYFVPGIAKLLPPEAYHHSCDNIDFRKYRNKKIAIIGGGDSAMDNALNGLEEHAKSVDVFIRKSEIRKPKGDSIINSGFIHGFPFLPDQLKLFFINYIEERTLLNNNTLQLISNFSNCVFHYETNINSLTYDRSKVFMLTDEGKYDFDVIIFATGFNVNLKERGELNYFVDKILLWGDKDLIFPQEKYFYYPYVGYDFEFLPKYPGACPNLCNLYCFNHGAMLNHGKITSNIRYISLAAERLARGISSSFFIKDHIG